MNRKSIYAMLALGCMVFAKTNVAAAYQPEYGTPVTNTVTVSFENSSAVFRPGQTASELLAAANEASMITIRGRTSTQSASQEDESLALARAVSARNYLIRQGVSPLKILINYVSAADFVADNGTREGRSLNQRVEIEMVYVPRY